MKARGSPATTSFRTAVKGVEAVIAARPQQRLDPKILRKQIDSFKPYLTSEASKGLPVGIMAAKDWDLAVQTMREVNLLPPDAKASDFYNDRLLDVTKIKALSGT